MLRIFMSVKRKETGQAAIEFALAILVFVPLLFGIIDFGWISFQKMAFEYGYIHTGWNVSASDLGDSDPIDTVPSTATYSGSSVSDPLYYEIELSSPIVEENLNITNATAVLYNNAVPYSVPSSTGGVISAVCRTRYMDISADLTYTIQPLTPIGELLYGSVITINKELKCTRVVATQNRSE